MIKKDIIIIGGGASGMMCAVKAKENDPRKEVVILEKQPRIGRKLLSTGNGRCNLTNLNCDKSCYNGSFAKYTELVLEKVSPQRVISDFALMGLDTFEESAGRVYPRSNQSSAVLDVLRFRLEALGVEVFCEAKVTAIESKNGGFIVKTENEVFSAKKVVVATGSCAAPKLGADSSGISALQSLGHRTVPLSPALCPLPVYGKLSAVMGVRASAEVGLYDGKRMICGDFGEVQFTETALSGICVFNLSSKVRGLRNPVVRVNLLPHVDNIIEKLTRKRDIFSQRSCEDFLVGTVNKKLGTYIMKCAGISPMSKKVLELTDDKLKKIGDNLTALSFKVSAPTDFNSAQVVSGGVHGDEINPDTTESKRVKNLYIIGEAVDIDGICGGFNLQFAFASGIIAGESL